MHSNIKGRTVGDGKIKVCAESIALDFFNQDCIIKIPFMTWCSVIKILINQANSTLHFAIVMQ